MTWRRRAENGGLIERFNPAKASAERSDGGVASLQDMLVWNGPDVAGFFWAGGFSSADRMGERGDKTCC